ncbi:MAG: hypothetical protein JWP12_2749 [Bacteroidetes bacterium]|nr:hypothetical protein [Bacteroidota bacterium]
MIIFIKFIIYLNQANSQKTLTRLIFSTNIVKLNCLIINIMLNRNCKITLQKHLNSAHYFNLIFNHKKNGKLLHFPFLFIGFNC